MDADAKIAYGVALDEGFETPWADDIEYWWRAINGYCNPYDPYDKKGNYKPEYVTREEKQAAFDKYWNFRQEWDKTHPKLPAELTYAGSGEGYTSSVLIIPESEVRTEWEPMRFHPEDLKVSELDKAAFHAFVEKYLGPELLDKIGWYLIPYYG